VLGIAIILLVLILAVIGYSLSYSTAVNWPPIVGDCPDYWIDLSGNGEGCYNSKNLKGNGDCTLDNKDASNNVVTMNFSGYTDCDKKDWATGCGITWDGITSGVIKNCNTTTTTTD
jgi:hypothetical protein